MDELTALNRKLRVARKEYKYWKAVCQFEGDEESFRERDTALEAIEKLEAIITEIEKARK